MSLLSETEVNITIRNLVIALVFMRPDLQQAMALANAMVGQLGGLQHAATSTCLATKPTQNVTVQAVASQTDLQYCTA